MAMTATPLLTATGVQEAGNERRGRLTKVSPFVAIPFAILVACNFADVVTTRRMLSMGGQEMNPVAGWLIANHGLPIAKFGIVAIIGACAMAAPRRRWITTGLWMVATLYALIITFHLTQLAMA